MDWIYFDCYDCVNFVWTVQNHLRVNLKNLTVSHEFNKKHNQDVLAKEKLAFVNGLGCS